MVDAGGIDVEAVGTLRIWGYPQVAALLIIVLVPVTIVVALSTMLRKRFKLARSARDSGANPFKTTGSAVSRRPRATRFTSAG